MTARVAAVILGAGRATRFGATKQLARWHASPMITHVVKSAQDAGLDPVVVVTGHNAQAIAAILPEDVTPVHNPAFATGQSSSLLAGIAAADEQGADAAVVLLADQPGVTTTAIRAVVGAHARGATVARVRYTDRPGHPVLFDRSVWPRLQDLHGDTGARHLLGALDVTEVAIEGTCPPDIDHPHDLDC